MAARSEPLMLYSTKRICAAIWTAVLLALLQYSETASELISHVLSLLSFKRVMLSHAALSQKIEQGESQWGPFTI